MTKIVINTCYGGFGLSKAAVMEYAKRKNFKLWVNSEHGISHYYRVPVEQYKKFYQESYARTGSFKEINETGWCFSENEIPRDDRTLVAIRLEVVESPDGVNWQIEEYDGAEWVAEKHRTWGWYNDQE